MNTETRSRRGRWKIAACVLLAAVALVALVKVSSRRKFRMYIWLR